MKAGVAQYIKGQWDCGERNVLEKLGVPFHVMATGFTWDTQNKELDTETPVSILAELVERVGQTGCPGYYIRWMGSR